MFHWKKIWFEIMLLIRRIKLNSIVLNIYTYINKFKIKNYYKEDDEYSSGRFTCLKHVHVDHLPYTSNLFFVRLIAHKKNKNLFLLICASDSRTRKTFFIFKWIGNAKNYLRIFYHDNSRMLYIIKFDELNCFINFSMEFIIGKSEFMRYKYLLK